VNIRQEIIDSPIYNFSEHAAKVKLDQNESAYDLPKNLKEKVLQRFAQLSFNRYPQISAQSLKEDIAKLNSWPADGVVISGGSNIMIQALVTAAAINKTVLTVAPSFSLYALQAPLQASELIEVPLNRDFSLPLEALIKELKRSSGTFFLANPAAPTANLFSLDELTLLAKASKDHWLFVIDEAYHEFSKTDFSVLIKEYPHVVSVRTFSKAYGLAGVRLGYSLSKPELAAQIQKLILPFSVSIFQIAVAEVVLKETAYMNDRLAEIYSERERVYNALKAMSGISPYKSVTNFILFRVADAKAFYDSLLAQGVLVRRQDHLLNLKGCLRVNIGSIEENNAFIQAAKLAAQREFGDD